MKVIHSQQPIIELASCKGGDVVQLVETGEKVFYLVLHSISTSGDNRVQLAELMDGVTISCSLEQQVQRFNAVLDIET